LAFDARQNRESRRRGGLTPSVVLAGYFDALLVAIAEQPAAVVVVRWFVAPALMPVLMRHG
jgi:hypothetical protein